MILPGCGHLQAVRTTKSGRIDQLQGLSGEEGACLGLPILSVQSIQWIFPKTWKHLSLSVSL